MKLLTSNPKTEKGCASSFEKIIVLLNDLSYSYTFSQIRNFVKTTLNTMVEIKELQLMGKYSASLKTIPEKGFNTEKIERLKRYDNSILEEINISRILLLKFSLEKYTGFDAEIALIQGVSEYLGAILENNKNNPNTKENFVVRRRYH